MRQDSLQNRGIGGEALQHDELCAEAEDGDTAVCRKGFGKRLELRTNKRLAGLRGVQRIEQNDIEGAALWRGDDIGESVGRHLWQSRKWGHVVGDCGVLLKVANSLG